jgi:hypothetical protein
MYRTLSQLRYSINQMIEQQGEDAPCAAFIFTKYDVFYYQMSDDGTNLEEVETYLDDEDTDDVLTEVGGCDYIYEQIGEVIDDEIRRVRNKQGV